MTEFSDWPTLELSDDLKVLLHEERMDYEREGHNATHLLSDIADELNVDLSVFEGG